MVWTCSNLQIKASSKSDYIHSRKSLKQNLGKYQSDLRSTAESGYAASSTNVRDGRNWGEMGSVTTSVSRESN